MRALLPHLGLRSGLGFCLFRAGLAGPSFVTQLLIPAQREAPSQEDVLAETSPVLLRASLPGATEGVPPDRFVTYDACCGFDASVEALQLALLFAIATNRTLLTQPFHLSAAGDAEPLPFASIFERPLWPTKFETEVNHTSLDNATLAEAFPTACSLDFGAIASRYASRPEPLLVLRGAPSLHWARLLAAPDLLEALGLLGRNLLFRTELVRASAALLHALPQGFAAAHWNLDPRARSSALVNCSNNGSCNRTGENQTLRPVLLDDALESFPPPNVSTLYLATNQPEAARVRSAVEQLKTRGVRTFVWDDLPENLRNEALSTVETGDAGFVRSVVERLICLAADLYQPSWPDSFDRFVLALRLAKAREDALEQVMLLASRDRKLPCEVRSAELDTKHLRQLQHGTSIIILEVLAAMLGGLVLFSAYYCRDNQPSNSSPSSQAPRGHPYSAARAAYTSVDSETPCVTP